MSNLPTERDLATDSSQQNVAKSSSIESKVHAISNLKVPAIVTNNF